MICQPCKGSGGVRTRYSKCVFTCPICDGLGYVPDPPPLPPPEPVLLKPLSLVLVDERRLTKANRSRRRMLADRCSRRAAWWRGRTFDTHERVPDVVLLRRARKLYALAMRLRGSP